MDGPPRVLRSAWMWTQWAVSAEAEAEGMIAAAAAAEKAARKHEEVSILHEVRCSCVHTKCIDMEQTHVLCRLQWNLHTFSQIRTASRSITGGLPWYDVYRAQIATHAC